MCLDIKHHSSLLMNFRRYQCQATVLVVALTDMEKEDLVITTSNLINLVQPSNRSKGVAVLFFLSLSRFNVRSMCYISLPLPPSPKTARPPYEEKCTVRRPED